MQKVNYNVGRCALYRFFCFFIGISTLSSLVVSALCSCTPYDPCAHTDTTDLNALLNLKAPPRSRLGYRPESSVLRGKMLSDAALSVGAQGGLAWAAERINVRLHRNRKYLETIYNFNGMMLSHGVLPPVLVKSQQSLNLEDPNTIRIADTTYKIALQARFATTPPNWREYLELKYTKPSTPDRVLLPRSKEEQKIWRKNVAIGWERGVQQAYSIFQQNLARLQRDYRGMILYRKLLQEKMISPPFVARTELGITGDGNDMRINDQILRIVELPHLQTNSKHWKAIVVPVDDTP